MVKIFSSELSRCLKVKDLYKLLFWTTLVGFFAYWIYTLIATPTPLTDKDKLFRFISCRFNFTPETVDKAYNCPYQYRYPYYETLTADERKYLKEHHVYSLFRVIQIVELSNGTFRVEGHLVQFSCKAENCLKIIDKNIALSVKKVKGNFVLEK